MTKIYFSTEKYDDEDKTKLILEDNILNNLLSQNSNNQVPAKKSRMYSVLRCMCFLGYSLVILLVLAAVVGKMAIETEKKTCQCSIVPTTYRPNVSESDTSYAVLDTHTKMQCDAEGVQRCKALCTSLAQRVPSLYWKKICSKEHNVEEYKGLLRYRPCSNSVWQLADMKMTICCADSAGYICPGNKDVQQEGKADP